MDTEYQRTAGSEFDWKNLTLFLITAGAVTVCALMLRPFLAAVTGAVVLAIVTQRPHQWITARQRSATLAATTSLILVTLCIIGPGDLTDDDELPGMTDAVVGIVTAHHYSASHDSPLNKAFVADFQKTYGKRPNFIAGLGCGKLDELAERLQATPAFQATMPEPEVLSNELA